MITRKPSLGFNEAAGKSPRNRVKVDTATLRADIRFNEAAGKSPRNLQQHITAAGGTTELQ